MKLMERIPNKMHVKKISDYVLKNDDDVLGPIVNIFGGRGGYMTIISIISSL